MLAFTSTIAIYVVLLNLYLLPCFVILLNVHLSAALSPNGFLSIDCGSSQTTNYTDALGIEWAPDNAIWPEISGWSLTSTVTPPVGDTTGGDKYKTLRYFPSADASTLKQSKFCYTLPATGDAYYLIRATFWYGTSATTTLYDTRVPGSISFRVMVDTYTGTWITIALPQSSPLTEEMYIRAQSGSSSVSVCFSAASANSDTPFISALELRPLPSKMKSAAMINNTNTALRTAAREDYGASDDAPSIIRYPDDLLDRLWTTFKSGIANRTNQPVAVAAMVDTPPLSVMQTSFMAPSAASGWSRNITTRPTGIPFKYYIALFFAEVDPRVNASGLRVFDAMINGFNAFQNFDVYAKVGLYTGFETYTNNPYGPYSDYIFIQLTSTPTSAFPPFVAAAEILQLFDNPIAPPTSSVDVTGIRGLRSALSLDLGRFTGDPCLPVEYKYPWINCTGEGIVPTRVISISLSNSNLAGNIPPSINNLDQVLQISLDGNALEGTLPVDLSNLLNLQLLNLSNNKLNGPIPDSLGKLPKLIYLDLRNNNLSGEIPISLQQKANANQLTFTYDGNPFLCLPNNTTCSIPITPPLPSPSPSASKLLLIIGLVVGALVVCIAVSIVITCILCHRRQPNPASTTENKAGDPQGKNEEMPALYSNPTAVPHVLSRTRIVEAANVSQAFTFQEIVSATGNFSTILGKGGFGIVYEGTLSNGTTVAVKVLSDASQQGTHQFLTEVTILSRVHHKNLVQLLGYCTKKKLVLVYEYMSNGSLYDCLFRKPSLLPTPLTWTQRLQILLDAARGLAYLHGSCNPRIIHMDVKSSNILLSKTLEGKMSDFGISRQNSNGVDVTTKLVASPGYIDPEFAATLILSEKVDIYSFGVVLLEVMCGQPPFIKNFENPDNAIHIVDWVRHYYERGDIERILFHGIGDYKVSTIWKVAEIALACAQYEGWKRPTMDEVCNELSEALILEITNHTIYGSTDTGEQFLLGEVHTR